MSDKKEYKVGEIFRHEGVTYQCVASTKNNFCNNCAFCDTGCNGGSCVAEFRADKTAVHFIRATEPKEGMLFRASDGKLYELKKLKNFECGCYIIGYTNCTVISYEAFGEDISDIFHWYPVEEKEEEEKGMGETKRHIELAVVKVDGDQVTFRIAEQTHRCGDFTLKGQKFKSRSGYRLESESCPGAPVHVSCLFVRGWLSRRDDAEVTAPLDTFARIMEAVNEYNETNGNGYETPWPQDGDKYYFIDSDSTIFEWNYTHDCTDEMRSSFGNFFRTREEAESARERVKKALKGE